MNVSKYHIIMLKVYDFSRDIYLFYQMSFRDIFGMFLLAVENTTQRLERFLWLRWGINMSDLGIHACGNNNVLVNIIDVESYKFQYSDLVALIVFSGFKKWKLFCCPLWEQALKY